MLLFVMAFVGNSLYVLSILTNPLMDSPGYLLESTPYLMGSGEPGSCVSFESSLIFAPHRWHSLFRHYHRPPEHTLLEQAQGRSRASTASSRPLRRARGGSGRFARRRGGQRDGDGLCGRLDFGRQQSEIQRRANEVEEQSPNYFAQEERFDGARSTEVVVTVALKSIA